jgi:acetyl-CoA/propionyl-CoA carboxylase, biotin carboxylase, biotin carboxyl carrier protein
MSAAAEIRATIPGTVSVLHVADGTDVAAGETVVEVECMKTLWPLTAPTAGIVRLQVALGEMVAQDQVLAIIETSE